MKIEELRIGNIVRNRAGELVVVESIISKDCILCSDENNKTKQTWGKYEEYELYPVWLSENLLSRFKFTKSDSTNYEKKNIKLTINDTGWDLDINYNPIVCAGSVKFLHQVQNLIFDTTGENMFKL